MTKKSIFKTEILSFIFVVLAIMAGCANAGNKAIQPQKPNALTKEEIAQGFELLFDGTLESVQKNFKGVADDNKAINTAWIIRDGAICNPIKEERSENISGSIVTKKQYANFDFRLDYKLEPLPEGKSVNSGIKYFAYPGKELGLEYQLFNADAKVEGPHALADLYDLLPAKSRKANPPGEWNTVRIVARGGFVEHYLNGVKVLRYERGGEEFRAAVAKSKFKDLDNFGQAEQGHILLQDHGGGIAFRNIRIRVLKD